MEWFTNIASSLSGLPWWAVLIVVLLSIACTKGVDALLRIWGARLEEKKYDDAHEQTGYDALVAELKSRIEKLEGLVDKQADKLDAATKAHANCEVEQAKLRGELDVMKEKVSRLETHDQANQENKKVLNHAVITTLAEQIVAKAEAAKSDTGPMPIVKQD